MRVDYKLIGQRIKAVRKEKKMTQEHLAEKLSVTVGYISQIERGITKISLDTLAQISSLLDSEIAYFITGASAGQDTYMQEELNRKYMMLDPSNKRMINDILDIFLKYGSEKR